MAPDNPQESYLTRRGKRSFHRRASPRWPVRPPQRSNPQMRQAGRALRQRRHTRHDCQNPRTFAPATQDSATSVWRATERMRRTLPPPAKWFAAEQPQLQSAQRHLSSTTACVILTHILNNYTSQHFIGDTNTHIHPHRPKQLAALYTIPDHHHSCLAP